MKKLSNSINSLLIVAVIFFVMACQCSSKLFNKNRDNPPPDRPEVFVSQTPEEDRESLTDTDLATEIVGRWKTPSVPGKPVLAFDFNSNHTFHGYSNGREMVRGVYVTVDERTIATKSTQGGMEKFPVLIQGDKMTMRYQNTDIVFYKE